MLVQHTLVWFMIILVSSMFFFGSQVVPEAHRGLLTLLGRRLPIAVPEGLVFYPPFICGVRPILVREQSDGVGIAHLSADGMSMSFTLKVFWHTVRGTEERRSWRRWFEGKLLLAFDNLFAGVGQTKIDAKVSEAVETVVATHTHDKLIGISIYELIGKLRAMLEQGSFTSVGDLLGSAETSSIATATRIQIAQQVTQYVAEGLKGDGIVVTMVTLERIDFDPEIQKLLGEIMKQWIDKAAQALDVAGDIQRTGQLVAAAKAAGQEPSFADVYALIRRYDNDEIAAKTGLAGNLLAQVRGAFADSVAA